MLGCVGETRADELSFAVNLSLGRLWALDGRLGEAREALESADRIADSLGSELDRASVAVPRLLLYLRLQDRSALLKLGRELQSLPDDVGPSTGLRTRLEAASLAAEGNLTEAVRRLDYGLRLAFRKQNSHAVVSLALARVDMAMLSGADYAAFRTLKTTSAMLKRWNAELGTHQILASVERHLHEKVGRATWALFAQRLQDDLMRRSTH